MISFRLHRAGAVELVVHSGCVVVGKKRVHGHGGLNRVRFNGRLHGRALAPGVYRISVVVDRHGTRTTVGSVTVQVIRPGARVTGRAPPAAPSCVVLAGGGSSGASLAAFVPVMSTSPPAGAAPRATSSTPQVQAAGIPGSSGGPGTSLRPPTLPVLAGASGGLHGFALALALLGGLGALVLAGYGVMALDSRLSRKPDARG